MLFTFPIMHYLEATEIQPQSDVLSQERADVHSTKVFLQTHVSQWLHSTSSRVSSLVAIYNYILRALLGVKRAQ